MTGEAGATVSIGNPAPSFKTAAAMPDKSIKTLSLKDYEGKYLVLFFYPLDFTFVCPTEIVAFSEKAEEFEKSNCALVGCSVDSEFTHIAWMETDRKKGGLGELKIPLLADVTRDIAKKYNCLMSVGHTCRATFIIDGKGIVRHMSFNDPPVGRSPEEVLRLVQGYQYTDEHGEVCPAGWTKGKKTIKPTPNDKLEYFKEVTA